MGLDSNFSLESEGLNISTHLRLSTQLGVVEMKRFTVSISKELKERLDKMPEVNWPEVMKQGILEKLAKLKKFEELENRGEL